MFYMYEVEYLGIITLIIVNTSIERIWNDIQDHIPINTSYSKFKSNTKNYFPYNNITYGIA